MASRAEKAGVHSCLLQSMYLQMLPSVYRALATGAELCCPLPLASPAMSIKACEDCCLNFYPPGEVTLPV